MASNAPGECCIRGVIHEYVALLTPYLSPWYL